jgi:hypothetical protein
MPGGAKQNMGTLGAIGPTEDAFALTPHAANAMPANKGFMVSVGGTMAIRTPRSAADVSITVLAGVVYPIALRYLRIVGTSATGIVGFN